MSFDPAHIAHWRERIQEAADLAKAGGKWRWREFLTDEERAVVEQAEAAKAEWERLQPQRASIQNRAIQRAKNAMTKAGLDQGRVGAGAPAQERDDG